MDVSKCGFPFLSGPTWPEYAVGDWVTSPVSEIYKIKNSHYKAWSSVVTKLILTSLRITDTF